MNKFDLKYVISADKFVLKSGFCMNMYIFTFLLWMITFDMFIFVVLIRL